MKKQNKRKSIVLLSILAVLIVVVCALMVFNSVSNSQVRNKISIEEAQKIVDQNFAKIPDSRSDSAKLIIDKSKVTVESIEYGDNKDVILSCSYTTINAKDAIIPNLNEIAAKAYTISQEKGNNRVGIELKDVYKEYLENAEPISGKITLYIYETTSGMQLHLSDKFVNTCTGGLITIIDEIDKLNTITYTVNAPSADTETDTSTETEEITEVIDNSVSPLFKGTIINCSVGVRVRSVPSLKSEEVGLVAKNCEVNFYSAEKNNEGVWFRTNAGWINANYVQTDMSLDEILHASASQEEVTQPQQEPEGDVAPNDTNVQTEEIDITKNSSLRTGIKYPIKLRNYSNAKPSTGTWLDNLWNDFTDEFHRNFIKDNNYMHLVKGLGNTLKITGLAALLGIFLGFLVAIVRCTNQMTGKLKILDAICRLYLTVIRGTPVMVQLIILYFVVLLPIGIKSFPAAVICFGLNSGAYVAEIVRGGVMSIDRGQIEAGRSLGFNYVQTMVLFVVPQAFKAILPALANEFITLLKESSIAFYIGVSDLTKGGLTIQSVTFSIFMPLVAVALIYLVLVLVLTQLVSVLERRLAKSDH